MENGKKYVRFSAFFSLSVLCQYIEIFKFSRIDVDTMDIKYEIINVIYFSRLLRYALYMHVVCP